MTAQWINACILKRGWNQYRVSIETGPPTADWTVAEEHSICLEGATDRQALETQLAELCEPPVSYEQAKRLLADLRGHVLGQTPTAIVGRKYATILLRLGARITDGLIFAPLVMLGTFFLLRSSISWMHIAWLVIIQIATLVYEILMLGIYGQTLGKMACGVIVRDISERPLNMKQAVLRNILTLILLRFGIWFYLPPIDHSQPPFSFAEGSLDMRVFGIISCIVGWADILTIFANPKRRALHDYIAGSVVIRTEADATFAATKR
jgi:uncharacterized RDD family membrane protein YckC